MDDLKFDNVIQMSKQLEFDFGEKIITFKKDITEEDIDKELDIQHIIVLHLKI